MLFLLEVKQKVDEGSLLRMFIGSGKIHNSCRIIVADRLTSIGFFKMMFLIFISFNGIAKVKNTVVAIKTLTQLLGILFCQFQFQCV